MRTEPVLVAACSLALGIGTALAAFGAQGDEPGLTIIVRDEVLHDIDSRIFGQFMERASWGEPGYDAARDPDAPRRLRAEVVGKMRRMNIPVIRWPAGADLIRIDWMDMIDNAPGRDGDRPLFPGRKGNPDLTNEFGLDEFLGLCEELESEPLLPVRFHSAVMSKDNTEQWARKAAGLVAYCNAEVGADLPEGMPDWPAIRKQNGREKPWGVRYFQIGNETWHYFNHALKKHGMEGATIKEKADLYLKNLRAFLLAMHEVDPTIEIVVDGVTGGGRWVDQSILGDPVVQEHAAYFSVHLYQPWGIRQIEKDGEKVAPKELSPEEVWYNWVAVPEMSPETGQSLLPGWPDWWLVRELDLPIACTEWNWNGWWNLGKKGGKPPLRSDWAKGIGAAGMLHAFMRSGNDVRIACQSMLVGESWGITAIRVNDEQAAEPYFMPTGRVTGFYSRHHGNQRLHTDLLRMPTIAQPLRINSIAPAPRVAAVDVVATQDPETVYLHLINRHISDAIPVQIELGDLGYEGKPFTRRCLTGNVKGTKTELSQETVAPEEATSSVTLDLPPRSVSILEFSRRRDE